MKRKSVVSISAVALIAVIALGLQLNRSNNVAQTSDGATSTKVFVGGDIHTLTYKAGEIEISGHESTATTRDFGVNWSTIKALDNADIMSWAVNGSTIFAGGHTGMYVSPNTEKNFKKINFYGGITDIHAVGASGQYVYVASPVFGLISSVDGGASWLPLSTQIGQGFMGTMLVDPTNPLKVLAPDMQLGLMGTSDGGKTWRTMGGPMGSMSIAWNPQNINEITVLGMSGAQTTKDGGTTWSDISIPKGTAAFTYSDDGKTLFAAALDAMPYAHIFRSIDGGKNWSLPTSSTSKVNESASQVVVTNEMDPNMPGMDHSDVKIDDAGVDRPLKATLGFFGIASSIVVSGAFILRRKDINEKKRKSTQRVNHGKKL